MFKEDNVLISKKTLSDLQSLAETLVKMIKISDGERKKNFENTLSEVGKFIDKALKDEIMTPEQYNRRFLDALGGEDKAIEFIEEAKKRRQTLSKRTRSDK